jgi:hypothetical protein
VLVDFNEERQALKLPTTSVESLVLSLREQLSISAPVFVTFYDPEMEEYLTLKKIEDLPEVKPKIKVVSQAASWWEWIRDSSWTEKGFAANRYYSVLVSEGIKTHHSVAQEKFKLVAAHLGFSTDLIHKIYAISNEKLLVGFNNHRDSIWGKHRKSPDLFKKTDWLQLDQINQRSNFLGWLDAFCNRFTMWNSTDESRPKVIPMLQGSSAAAVWQICQQGFGVTATTDDGFYGRGIYFTSKLSYAAQYAKTGTEGKVFLLSMVIPGNSFPVVENPQEKGNLVGQACRPGYQSHFTLVDGRNVQTAYPIKGAIDSNTAEELGVFNEAQALPLFVIFMK